MNFLKNLQTQLLIFRINAYLAFPNNPGYVTSKGGLISLTRSLANDFGKFKIELIAFAIIKKGMTLKSYTNLKKKRIETMLGWDR